MAAELDMSQYLGLFLQEAEEQFEILEQEALKLEADPSPERMSAIFRAAHTLKGSSRAMGFSNLANVTHEMENVLDALRQGRILLRTEIADALLECLDTLRAMKVSIEAGSGDAIDGSGLVSKLQSFLKDPENLAQAAQPKSLPDNVMNALQLVANERPVYCVKFTLRTDCVMKFVRAFMAINIVNDGGELLATIPDTESIEEERFDREFELFFQHESSIGLIKTKFDGIGEVEKFELKACDFNDSQVSVSAVDTNLPVASPLLNAVTPTTTEAAPTEAVQPGKKTEAAQTVRVDVARLDELMNLVGELVIDRTRVAQIGAALAARYQMDDNIQALAETVGHLSRITSDLQDQLMKARMLPIETVLNRFPRVVRDLAQKLGKDIKLELKGGETELDRSVIEVIGDPLLHILRNSIDHGIELPDQREKIGKPRTGTVTISARHHENHIVIDIVDDGNGIDVTRIKAKAIESGLISADAAERMTDKDALQLIFASGLSTASQVTEVSGRGVGMDIVRSNIQKLGGLVDVETEIGKGSHFSLRLPLTLAIIRGLLVKVSGVVYVLPLGSVVETLKIDKTEVQTVKGREVIVIRGVTMPLIRLRRMFATRNFTDEPASDSVYAVIVGLAEQRVGLVVDSLVGEQEVVIKSLSRFCGDIRGISGATILGNGNVALIVDVNGVLSMDWRS